MERTKSFGWLFYLAFALPVAAARDNSVSIDAESLGGIVLGRSIELMTSDGVYVAGKVIRATRQEITLKVKHVKPEGRFRGGEVTIKSTEVSVVHMRKGGPIVLPIALGILGGFFGGAGASYAAYSMGGESGVAAACLIGVIGGATGGAVLGREAAKRTVTINITQPSKAPIREGGRY